MYNNKPLKCVESFKYLGSCFTYYTSRLPPNHKTIFLAKRGNNTDRYMFEPIPLSAIQTITSMRRSSHALRGEMGHWVTSNESGWLCKLCLTQVQESEYHTLILYLWSSSTLLSTYLQPNSILARMFLTITMFAIVIGKVLEHWESRLTFTRTTWTVIFFVSYIIFDLQRQ